MAELPLEQTFADYLVGRNHRQRVQDSLTAIATLKKYKLIPVLGSREQIILAKFAGWGTLSRLFTDSNAPMWEQQARAELEQLLTPDELADCRSTMLNAFPTSPQVIAAMWEFLRQIDWQGGKVLDPGCGIAAFLTFCPDDLRPLILRYIGVEIEPLTCDIAKRLHPDKDLRSFWPRSFLDMPYPANTIDLAIGNVPFEDGLQAPYNGFKHSVALHARILIKTLDLLKPGGLAFLITSTGLMDSTGGQHEYVRLREWIDEKALFLGALRLPAQTHEGISGSQCTSDLILLQKRIEGDDLKLYDWLDAVDSDLLTHKTRQPIPYSEYYRSFPDRLIGTPVPDRTTFGDDFALDWLGDGPLADAIASALSDWADVIRPIFSTVQLDSQTTSQTTQETTPMHAQTEQANWRNFTITANESANGIEIRFPAKPPSTLTDRIKTEARFRFTEKNSDPRWYATQSPDRWAWVQRFGAEYRIDVVIPANHATPTVGYAAEMPPAPTPQPAPQPAPQPVTPPMTPERPISNPSTSTDSFDWGWIDSLIESTAELINQDSEAEAARIRAQENSDRIEAHVAAQLADYRAKRESGEILAMNNRLRSGQLLAKMGVLGLALVIQITAKK